MEPVLRSGAALSVLVIAGLLWSCGNGGGGDTTQPPTHGVIQVEVTRDGSPAAGVGVSLFTAGSTTSQATATTSAAGSARFEGLEPGPYEVEVAVPSGVELDGEPRRAVSVVAGGTATVTFGLETGGLVEVVMTGGLQFSPSDLTIEVGQTVRWRNEAAMLHTITPDGHSEWSSATVTAAGATFSHTFDSAGEFPYFCEPHLAQGMTGVIRVQ
jgi:plastocyanin